MWAKIDDGVGTHRKHLAAGPVACWLWVTGLAWANRHATDGLIPTHALPALYPSDALSKIELRRSATKLVEVGLWEPCAAGWLIHDYAQYQGEAMRSARDERRKWEAERKAKQRAAKKNLGAERDSAHLGTLSHRDRGGTGVGHVPGTNGGTAPGTGAPAVSQPPVPSRPVQIGITHTPREGGPPRLGTVELFGLTGEDVVNALRVGAKGRVNLAHDSRTLGDLGDLVRDLAALPDAGADLAGYQVLAAWVGAGGLAWYDHGAPTLAYLLKPGVLAQHLAEAAQWHREGRPAIKTRKAAASDAASRGNPRSSYVGPIPPAPRAAFEHATLAAKLGLRWKAPTDGSDRDAAWLSQHGFSVDEARARVAALPNARTGT